LGVTANPSASVASGIWTVREAEAYLRANEWPATPSVPGSPACVPASGQVALSWSAPTLGSPATDYQVQYSPNSGASWTTFADGTSTATSAVVTGLTNGTGYIFRVRAVNALGEGPYGAASGVVTPTGINAALLLHFDGSNGSTTFTDSSPNALTVTGYGNAQNSTAESKFGGASGYFSGPGSPGAHLTVESSEALAFGTGDFTIELWVYFPDEAARSAGAYFVFTRGVSPLYFVMNENFGGFAYATNGSTIFATSSIVPAAQWVHLALVRNNGQMTIYVNGVGGTSGTSSDNFTQDSAALFAHPSFSELSSALVGYVDELRIVKGTAVYTSNFTPPTAPF
jgi:hypothetical protein